MRTLSANALAKLQTRYGTEPVVILEIQWIQDGGWVMYADRDIDDIVKGKVLQLGELDDVVGISANNDSQELPVTLDDTDGSIKLIMNQHDIHKRNVRVWQWFDGLNLDDKFLLFRGKINSPIEWVEGEQSVSFSIISQLEDKEFGFSPEEGDFDFIPTELIGQPWPSIFGTPLDVPVVAIGQALHGTTLAGTGIISGPGYSHQAPDAGDCGLAIQNVQRAHASLISSCWLGVDHDEWQKWEDQRAQLAASIDSNLAAKVAQRVQQAKAAADQIAEVLEKGQGASIIKILGGESFPRQCTLNIGGGIFTGYFGDTDETSNIFYVCSRHHPENLAAYNEEVQEAQSQHTEIPPSGGDNTFDFYSKVPCGKGDFFDRCHIHTHGGCVILTPLTATKATATVPPKHFWAAAGSDVTLYGSEPITYIVSIVPGTVLAVKAFKTFNGVKHLVDVPTNLYTVGIKTYGSIEAAIIVVNKTLSTIPDQNWGDDLYVTFESSVGPNIVDILEYVIDLYTEFNVDNISFDAVRTKLESFPANFAVLDRKNVLTVLQEIAYQARCNLRLINGTFYLTYLAEEPTAIDLITESDIETNSIIVTTSPTEDLVTKLVAEWRISYAQSDMNKLILRHNVKKYGIQEETYEFYLYNQPEIILKVATFWLIRKANTWKHIKFRTFMQKLNVESFDCVTLDFDKPYIADGLTKAVVTVANVDTDNYLIDMDCWLPIKFGEMVPYDFAWPANVSSLWVFPTDDEVNWGYDGGAGVGEDAEGQLPIGPTADDGTRRQIQVNGTGVTHRGKADRGDKHPSDQGFDPQEVENKSQPGEAYYSNPPAQKSSVPENEPSPKVEKIPLPNDALVIDLKHTYIMDSDVNETEHTSLRDVFLMHSDDGIEVCLRKGLKVKEDGGEVEEYDFRFDEEGGKWGSGTCFLKGG